jgi:hypothetical protein
MSVPVAIGGMSVPAAIGGMSVPVAIGGTAGAVGTEIVGATAGAVGTEIVGTTAGVVTHIMSSPSSSSKMLDILSEAESALWPGTILPMSISAGPAREMPLKMAPTLALLRGAFAGLAARLGAMFGSRGIVE